MRKKYLGYILLFVFLPLIVVSQVMDTLRFPASLGYSYNQLRSKTDIGYDAVGETFWISFSNAGALKFSNGVWTRYTASPNQLPTDNVKRMRCTSNGEVWFATDLGLTSHINNTWQSYPLNLTGFSAAAINAIAVSSQYVYLGTTIGLIVFARSQNSWSVVNQTNSIISSDSINGLCFSRTGDLIIATSGGVSFYNGVVNYSYTMSNSNLSSNLITDVATTNMDTIVSTAAGLYFINGGKFLGFDSLYFSVPSVGLCPGNYGVQYWDRIVKNKFSRFSSDALGNVYYIDFRGSQFDKKIYSISNDRRMLVTKLSSMNYDLGSSALGGPFLTSSNDSIYAMLQNGQSSTIFRQKLLDGFEEVGLPLNYNNVPYFLATNPPHVDLFSSVLNANNIATVVLNGGDLHWDPITQVNYYNVPRATTKNSVYCSALWMGGLDAGNVLRTAAQTYRQNGTDFWPGPIVQNGANPQAVLWDSLWSVRRQDVDRFRYEFSLGNVQNGQYHVPDVILHWPAVGNTPLNTSHALAPFVDVNQDGVYHALDGDYPLVQGDQMIWTCFNDVYGTKTETNSPPMGLEIQLQAYAYNCVDALGHSPELAFTTFYRYDIYNYSANNYHDFYLGMWSDMDLGNPTDDYVACHLPTNSFCTYNGDAFDDGGSGFGTCAPIQNVVVMKAPLAPATDGKDNNHNGVVDEPNESLGLSSFTYYQNTNGIPTGNPATFDDYYDYLTGHWLDGQPVTFGGDGRGGGNGATADSTTFMYSGASNSSYANPWSMATANMPPDDMRGIGSIGPITLPAGGHITLEFAFLTGSGDSVANLNGLTNLHNLYNSGLLANTYSVLPAIVGPDSVSDAYTATYTLPFNVPTGSALQWTVRGGAILSGQGSSSVTVLWGNKGSAQVEVELLSSSVLCRQASTLPVYIKPRCVQPTVSLLGSNTFCQGSPVTLYAPSGSGYSYQWYRNGAILPGATSSNYTTLLAGNYAVGIDSGGCYKVSSAQAVSFYGLPTVGITNSTGNTVCSGSAVVLNGTGAATYAWDNGISNNTTFYPTSTKTYQVIGTDVHGCTGRNSITISVNNVPPAQSIIGNPSITPFQNYLYVVNNVAGVSFNWLIQGGAIVNGQGTNSINVMWGGSGPYLLQLVQSFTNGCNDTMSLAVINSNCSLSYTVQQTGTVPYCQGDSVSLNVSTATGTQFQWYFNGAPISGASSATYVAKQFGLYQVQLTQSGCTVMSNGNSISFLQAPTTPIITASTGNTGCLGGTQTLTCGGGFSGYLWSNGSVNPSIVAGNSGNYVVTVTGANGCKSISAPYYVNLSLVSATDICLVTVDAVTNKNNVIWEKPFKAGIDSFYIYKETTSSNVYLKIGSVDVNALSTFVDLASTPAQRADRYKIAILDTCGFESFLSAPHKTIHLSINQGIGNTYNLIWDAYEGFIFGSYYILRGSAPGNLSVIDSLQSNLLSYTDLNPPSGSVYYAVEVRKDYPCNPTARMNSAGPISSRSNIRDNSLALIEDFSNPLTTFSIVPNPATESATITFSLAKSCAPTIVVYDVTGRVVHSLYSATTPAGVHSVVWDLNENNAKVKSGIYLVKISMNGYSETKRVVVLN